MNNEPPLILISKQLLIVYKASGWSREEMTEGREGRKLKKSKRCKQVVKEEKMGNEGRKEKHIGGNITT